MNKKNITSYLVMAVFILGIALCAIPAKKVRIQLPLSSIRHNYPFRGVVLDNDSNSYAVGSEGCCQAWVSKTDIDVTCYRSIVGFNLRIVDSRDSLIIKKANTEVQDKYEKGGLGAVLF